MLNLMLLIVVLLIACGPVPASVVIVAVLLYLWVVNQPDRPRCCKTGTRVEHTNSDVPKDSCQWASVIPSNILCGYDALRIYVDKDGLIDWTGCTHGPGYVPDASCSNYDGCADLAGR